MKLRLAWIGDFEHQDSYSAAEARILLRAFARGTEVLPIWFAVGSQEPPHLWDGVRVFPVPVDTLESAAFLRTLIAQQRPDVILSNVAFARFPAAFECLRERSVRWIHRTHPEDIHCGRGTSADMELVGEADLLGDGAANRRLLPYIEELHPTVCAGASSTEVLEGLREALLLQDRPNARMGNRVHPCHLVMRQQLFCNTSLAQVMFELTNALLELGVPAVPQDEHQVFSTSSYIHREEEVYRAGAPDKYARVSEHLTDVYDPETAVTVHFSLIKTPHGLAYCGTFPCLCGREVLYTTGNHTVRPQDVRLISDRFELLLAPSSHVLRPYLEAGLARRCGAIVPHGVDPKIFCPESQPLQYPSKKGFKFLQTSFPWVYEKGFDLTVKAFSRAFSSRDDVALVLRVPRVNDPNERAWSFDRLSKIVAEELSKPAAPEILLLESDVEPDQRGGVYTGADCYVHPLRAEGFGMTILEAIACGLPVIATPWSGPADFLSPAWAYTVCHSGPIAERAKNGSILRYHVEPDIDHLIHHMRQVFENPARAKSFGRTDCAIAHHHWTWSHAAAKLASLFAIRTAFDRVQENGGFVGEGSVINQLNYSAKL